MVKLPRPVYAAALRGVPNISLSGQRWRGSYSQNLNLRLQLSAARAISAVHRYHVLRRGPNSTAITGSSNRSLDLRQASLTQIEPQAERHFQTKSTSVIGAVEDRDLHSTSGGRPKCRLPGAATTPFHRRDKFLGDVAASGLRGRLVTLARIRLHTPACARVLAPAAGCC